MKTRRLLPMLLLVLTIPLPPVIAQGTNSQYLSQLPSRERINRVANFVGVILASLLSVGGARVAAAKPSLLPDQVIQTV